MAGTILPALAFGEALETTRIHSIAGLPRPEEAIVARRPFCAPHGGISQPGLVGGGSVPQPGKIRPASLRNSLLSPFAQFPPLI